MLMMLVAAGQLMRWQGSGESHRPAVGGVLERAIGQLMLMMLGSEESHWPAHAHDAGGGVLERVICQLMLMMLTAGFWREPLAG